MAQTCRCGASSVQCAVCKANHSVNLSNFSATTHFLDEKTWLFQLACCKFDSPHLVGAHVCNQQVALGAWQEHHVHGCIEPGTQGRGDCVAGLDGRGQAGYAGNCDDVRAAAVGDELPDEAVACVSCRRRPVREERFSAGTGCASESLVQQQASSLSMGSRCGHLPAVRAASHQ